jgi:hypothetical protein
MKVMLVNLPVQAVAVVVVVEDKQPGGIMDLVAMDLVVAMDPALVMQVITTIMDIVMQMHILMVVVVEADKAPMVGTEAAAALDLVLAMPTRKSLRRANPNMKPNPLDLC